MILRMLLQLCYNKLRTHKQLHPLPTSHPRHCRQGPLGNTWLSRHRHCHCHRRRPPSPSLSATTAIVAIMGFVVAWCHLPPPSSSSLSTTSQPHQQCNHCRLAPILLPPCNPPPPHCRRALSALSIAHGAILDRHASSTSSGMTC